MAKTSFALPVLEQQLSMGLLSQHPEAATQYGWLRPTMLAFATADAGIDADLKRRQQRGEPPPVCGKGCHACCLAPTLLVTQFEVQALSWFLSEILEEPARSRVKAQIRTHRDRTSCPFLLDGACSVYPVRPLTCRQFVVVGHACSPDEDVLKTRPDDIIKFSAEPQREAAVLLLEELGLSHKDAVRAAGDGTFFRSASPLHLARVEVLADSMDHFDRIRASR